MSTGEPTQPLPLCFIIGPLRTGSSLMARCIDDHPRAICHCESEINPALFEDYNTYLLHDARMTAHGISSQEVLALLDRKKQEDVGSLTGWYQEVAPRLMQPEPGPARAPRAEPPAYRR